MNFTSSVLSFCFSVFTFAFILALYPYGYVNYPGGYLTSLLDITGGGISTSVNIPPAVSSPLPVTAPPEGRLT